MFCLVRVEALLGLQVGKLRTWVQASRWLWALAKHADNLSGTVAPPQAG